MLVNILLMGVKMLEMMDNIGGLSYYVRKIGLLLIVLIVGFSIGYIALPTKVITRTVTVKELVKTNVKTHQVTTTTPSGTVTVIDTLSNQTSDTSMASASKVEINKKEFTVMAYGGIGREERIVGFMAQKDIIGSIGVVFGAQYGVVKRDAVGIAGISLKF